MKWWLSGCLYQTWPLLHGGSTCPFLEACCGGCVWGERESSLGFHSSSLQTRGAYDGTETGASE